MYVCYVENKGYLLTYILTYLLTYSLIDLLIDRLIDWLIDWWNTQNGHFVPLNFVNVSVLFVFFLFHLFLVLSWYWLVTYQRFWAYVKCLRVVSYCKPVTMYRHYGEQISYHHYHRFICSETTIMTAMTKELVNEMDKRPVNRHLQLPAMDLYTHSTLIY